MTQVPRRLLSLYIAVEVGIGIFGLLSPYIIEGFGQAVPSTRIVTAMLSFAILAFPTILMGATFPILVTHVNKIHHNIGHSVGALYFANTLGGALGAYFSGFILLYIMDVVGAIDRAAWLNFAVAAIAWLAFRRSR